MCGVLFCFGQNVKLAIIIRNEFFVLQMKKKEDLFD